MMQQEITVGFDREKWSTSPGECSASSGDEITWRAEETALTLWFPEESLFGQRELSIASGGTATLTVGKNVEPGRYAYAVYCHDPREFASGSLHPVMIIE